jgi:putative ABC transport system substrate-binding protein
MIPIVFIVTEDPVKLGLVASLARPDGNATGINFYSGELTAKRLEFLREVVPAATRVAVLVNPTNVAVTVTTLRDVQSAARAMGLQIQVVNASTSHEINAAFATFVRERPDALFVGLDVFLNNRRAQLVNLASRHTLPATFSNREIVEVGGLMSYGSNIADAFVRSASMPVAYSKVPSRRNCRSCRRTSSSWSSTPRLQGCFASPCRPRCSP